MENHSENTAESALLIEDAETESEKTAVADHAFDEVCAAGTSPLTAPTQDDSHHHLRDNEPHATKTLVSSSHSLRKRRASKEAIPQICDSAEEKGESSEPSDIADGDYTDRPTAAASRRPGRPSRGAKKSIPLKNKTSTSASKKRGKSGKETSNERNTKQARKATSHDDINAFRHNLGSLDAAFEHQVRTLESAKQQIESLEHRLAIVQENLDQERNLRNEQNNMSSRTIEKLKEGNVRLVKQHIEIRAKMETLLEPNHPEVYTKESDESIIQKWNELSYSIHNFVSQCRKWTTEGSAINATSSLKLCVQEAAKEYQKSMSLAVKQFIWQIIIEQVFWGRGQLWHGNFGEALTRFVVDVTRSDANPEQFAILSRVKSSVAEANDKYEVRLESAEILVNNIVLEIQSKDSDLDLDGSRKQVREMIFQAIELHNIFMRSKALFVLVLSPQRTNKGGAHPLQFLPAQMENIMGSGLSQPELRYVVDQVIEPGILKVGNADGEKFDKVMVLQKAKVTVKEVFYC